MIKLGLIFLRAMVAAMLATISIGTTRLVDQYGEMDAKLLLAEEVFERNVPPNQRLRRWRARESLSALKEMHVEHSIVRTQTTMIQNAPGTLKSHILWTVPDKHVNWHTIKKVPTDCLMRNYVRRGPVPCNIKKKQRPTARVKPQWVA